MKLLYWKGPGGETNFGDELNPWLWQRLLPGVFDEDDRTVFYGIGTVLGSVIKEESRKVDRRLVFGSGAGYGQIPRMDRTWNIYCVRGPLTAQALALDDHL